MHFSKYTERRQLTWPKAVHNPTVILSGAPRGLRQRYGKNGGGVCGAYGRRAVEGPPAPSAGGPAGRKRHSPTDQPPFVPCAASSEVLRLRAVSCRQSITR